MKRLLFTYGLVAVAGVFSFLFALNLREIVLMIYRATAIDSTMFTAPLVNTVTVIMSMLLWIIYIFYLQHRLEKRCEAFEHYRQTILIYILPMPVLYGISETAIRSVIG